MAGASVAMQAAMPRGASPPPRHSRYASRPGRVLPQLPAIRAGRTRCGYLTARRTGESERSVMQRSCPGTRPSPAAPGRPGSRWPPPIPGHPAPRSSRTSPPTTTSTASGRTNEKVALEVAMGASIGGRPRPGGHEARGPQRGRRPALHRLLHRRQRRPRHRHRRRPRPAQLPERAGQPQLRASSPRSRCIEPSDSQEAKDFVKLRLRAVARSSTPRCSSAPPPASRTPRAWWSWANRVERRPSPTRART